MFNLRLRRAIDELDPALIDAHVAALLRRRRRLVRLAIAALVTLAVAIPAAYLYSVREFEVSIEVDANCPAWLLWTARGSSEPYAKHAWLDADLTGSWRSGTHELPAGTEVRVSAECPFLDERLVECRLRVDGELVQVSRAQRQAYCAVTLGE